MAVQRKLQACSSSYSACRTPAHWRLIPAASAVIALIAGSGLASAQETKKEPEAAATAVVVTGSRIKRMTSSAPVTQVDSTFIEELGLSSVGDLLQTQPAFGVGQGSQTVNHSSADAGSSFADLRTLGTQRTLVLFDGRRRVSGSAVSGAVDLSTLAPALIETTDIVTGGASAVYGADAVSGVVNFRLKRDIRGLVGGIRTGITQEGGGNERDAHLGVGSTFAGGKGAFSVLAGYNQLGQLSSMDRSFTETPRRLLPNPDDKGVGDGQPAQIVYNDYRFANFDRGGSICLRNTDGSISRFIAIPGGIRPFQGQLVGPSTCGTYALGGDGVNPAKQLNLRSGLESVAVISQISYNLKSDLKAYVNLDFSHARSIVIGEEVADGQSALIIKRDNPFIPAALATELDKRGLTSFGLGRSHFDFGRRIQERNRDTYTVEAGLKGSLSKSWTWEAFAQQGTFKANTRIHGDRINANFFRAVDAVVNPVNGQPMCRDTTAAGCIPLNVLGVGAASAAALNYVLYSPWQDMVSKQTIAGGSVSGEVAQLPAGPLQVVAGVEYREESLNIEIDSLSRQRALFQGLGVANLNAGFDVREGFIEGAIPLLRNIPLARRLTLEGAVRVSDYNTIGRTNAGRLGGTWELSAPLSVRVQRSASVRAPSLFELYSPETVSRANVIDPCSGGLRTANANRAANCTALGLPQGYADPRSAESEFIYAGGNANLKPEKSNSWSIGGVWKGSIGGNSLVTSLDYWSIDIKDAIQSLNIERIINGCVDAATINNPLCGLVTRDRINGGITEVKNYASNIASLLARGVDYQIRYAIGQVPSLLRTNDAYLTASLSGSYLMKRNEVGNVNDPATLTILAGEIGFPKHRTNLQFRYTDGPLSASWSTRFISGVKLDMQLPKEFYAPGINDVSSRLYHDVSAFYDVNKTVRLQVGVRNLFNLAPPNTPQHSFGNSAYAGIGTGGLYDNLGRTFMLGLNMKL